MVSIQKGEGGWVTQKDGIPGRWSRMSEGAGSSEWSTRLSYKKGAEQKMDRRARSRTDHEGPYMPSSGWPNLCLIANGSH